MDPGTIIKSFNLDVTLITDILWLVSTVLLLMDSFLEKTHEASRKPHCNNKVTELTSGPFLFDCMTYTV